MNFTVNDPIVRLDRGATIGIDLGTTMSEVASFKAGYIQILGDEMGSRMTPSIVAFQDGQIFFGAEAKEVKPASQQVFDVKRLIGRQWGDTNVQKDRARWPFEVVEKDGVPRIKVQVNGEDKLFSPEEIFAMVLRKLKDTAETNLKQAVSKAVVTVPAYFNERQRQATKEACRIAGLEVLGMINEPTAAAIAYGMEHGLQNGRSKTVVVYDLGGGNFGVSVMRIVDRSFQVLASGGDTHLGGQDFDELLFEHCLEEFNKLQAGSKARKHKKVREDTWSFMELRRAIEQTKRRLSVRENWQVTWLPANATKRLELVITRGMFEGLCRPLFTRTLAITQATLKDAKVPVERVDEVVLVGGSSRIPKVQEMLRDMFGGKKLRQSIHADEAVAYGAAVHAANLSGDRSAATLIEVGEVTITPHEAHLNKEQLEALVQNATVPVPVLVREPIVLRSTTRQLKK